jgi:FKBP-type peptidyl-prolyl cis-trans isomerase SlyD
MRFHLLRAFAVIAFCETSGGEPHFRIKFHARNHFLFQSTRDFLMQIAKGKVVSMDYTLTDDAGEMLDTSKGGTPLVYLHGIGGIIPGLERGLEGRSTGDNVQVKVAPEDAYGLHQDALIESVPRSAFRGVEKIEPGMTFQAAQNGQTRVVTVVGVDQDTVRVDANHPLAGKTLYFDVTIVEVRDATPEELQHGHAHGPGGHHHH